MGFTEEDERPRPQFAANAPYLEKNPITGIREPAFPAQVRLRRVAAGGGLILVMVTSRNERMQLFKENFSDKSGFDFHPGCNCLQNHSCYMAI